MLGVEQGKNKRGQSGSGACKAWEALEETLDFIQNMRGSHCGVTGRQVTS